MTATHEPEASVAPTRSTPTASEARRRPAPGPPKPSTTVSGLYESRQPQPPWPPDTAQRGALWPWWPSRRGGSEALRLDVDGPQPQMVASGTIRQWLTGRLHWIANLTPSGKDAWTGTIFYKDGNESLLPHTSVRIRVTGSPFPEQRLAQVSFRGQGRPLQRTYRFASPSFHTVEFEFDWVEGTSPVTDVDTGAHPNRPASLPAEILTIEETFARAGFEVNKSGGDSQVPLSDAGADERWTDQEMHDAMQVYWSRFDDAPQWSLWVLWAGLYQSGTNMGGIMFDDIGPNHRQGTAIFTDSFISNPPAGDPNPDAWVQRMQFWTAVHEMGHAFNLAHSWQKSLGAPWIPLDDEPEARSYMNYPYNVSGGQTAFFADFAYRFSDAEALFLRHAPERFVQMGNADWFDDHGFEQATVSAEPAFAFELRVNRASAEYEFLEPVMVEMKLKNESDRPQIVDGAILSSNGDFTVVVKRDRQPARRFRPFARYCTEPDATILAPGEALYESVFLSAGTQGWDIAEPGRYLVQAALHLEDEDVVSNPLSLRVRPPRSYDEEDVAQDVFTEEVARVLAFGGSRVLSGGNDVLAQAAERLPDRRVARHARYALGAPLAEPAKLLQVDGRPAATSLGEAGSQFAAAPAQPEVATDHVNAALATDMDVAAETFGHIPYKRRVDHFCDILTHEGHRDQAARLLDGLQQTLSARGVLDRVLSDIAAHRERIVRHDD